MGQCSGTPIEDIFISRMELEHIGDDRGGVTADCNLDILSPARIRGAYNLFCKRGEERREGVSQGEKRGIRSAGERSQGQR